MSISSELIPLLYGIEMRRCGYCKDTFPAHQECNCLAIRTHLRFKELEDRIKELEESSSTSKTINEKMD